MRVDELTVEVRNADLERVGQLVPSDLVGAVFVSRFNNVGSWTIKLPFNSPMGDLLRTPGFGLIVTGPEGVLISGPTTSSVLEQTSDNLQGDWVISGADDSLVLAERLAFPDPAVTDPGAQTVSHDSRSGAAESVLKAYVDANLVTVPTARKVAHMTVESDLGRGSTVSANARFDKLQDLLFPMAQTGGIGYTVEQDGSDLVFKVYEPIDRSSTIRMDLANNQLSKTTYSYLSPQATRAIVAGQGESVERIFVETSTTDSILAEALWGRRIERFVDARSSAEVSALQQAGEELLVDNGKTVESLSVTPSDDQRMRYGYDWGLGDRVTVVVGQIEAAAVVTEVGIGIGSDGVRISATIGTPVPLDVESKLVAKTKDADARIGNLERNTTGFGISTTYQPNGGTSGTQPTFSGPAIFGSYTRFGNMAHFAIDVDFSNIIGFGTGQYFLTLPYNSAHNYQLRDGCLHDISAGTEYHISGHILAGSNVLWLSSSDKVGSNIQDVDFTRNSPVTLSTADNFHIAGTYEIET